MALLALIVLIAALLRFWDPGSWPVFLDEDMYTSVARALARLPWSEALMVSQREKAPLPFYIQGNIGLLTGSFLIAGRLVTACAGTVTTALAFVLGKRIVDSRVGLVTAALYAVSPVAILHERMALLDGPMSALSLAAVLLGWAAVERQSWIRAGIACLLGYLAVQYKVPAVATALLLPLALLSYRRGMRARAKYAAAVAMAPLVSYVGLAMSPVGAGLTIQNAGKLRNPSLALLSHNLSVLRDCVAAYLPAGLWLFILAGAVLLLWNKDRRALLPVAAVLVWSLPWLIVSTSAPSRYYMPTLPYAYALAAVALVWLPTAVTPSRRWTRAVPVVISAAVVAASGVAGVQMVSAHSTAAMSGDDDLQYRSGWPSGYPYQAAHDFISRAAEAGSAVAFVVDDRHAVGAGVQGPLPQGVTSLGLVRLDTPLPTAHRGAFYAVVDDNVDEKPGQRLSAVLAREPRLRVIADFRRPDWRLGTYVLFARIGDYPGYYSTARQVAKVMDASVWEGHYHMVLSSACDPALLQTEFPYQVRLAGSLVSYPPAASRATPPGRVLTALNVGGVTSPQQLSASLFRVAGMSSHLWYLQCGNPSDIDLAVEAWISRYFPAVERLTSPGDPDFTLAHVIPKLPLPATEDALEPSGAVFGNDEIRLVGYKSSVDVSEGARVLRVALVWKAERTPAVDFHVFVHLLDANGKLVAQSDGVPVYDRYPFRRWAAGDTVSDYYDVPIPSDLVLDRATVVAGLYDFTTGARLSVDGSDHVTIR